MAAKKARTSDAGLRVGADSHPAVEWLWEWMGRLFRDRFGHTPLRANENAATVLQMLRKTTPAGASRANRAAGWNLWINAVIGYVRLRHTCPRTLALTRIAQERDAFAANGAEVRRRLMAGEPPLPIEGPSPWPMPRSELVIDVARLSGEQNHPLYDLPKNLSTLPDPWAPYYGEQPAEVKPPAFHGWDKIAPEVARLTGKPSLSERSAREWCKKHGVTLRNDRGRKWVEWADLERAAKLPPSRK